MPTFEEELKKCIYIIKDEEGNYVEVEAKDVKIEYKEPPPTYKVIAVDGEVSITLDYKPEFSQALIEQFEKERRDQLTKDLKELHNEWGWNRHARRAAKSKHRGERGFRSDFGKPR
jgi:hypothetical protein